MFPFWMKSCCGFDDKSFQHMRKGQLQVLKMIRDNLECRLSAINAAIDTMENQVNAEDSTSGPAEAS